MELKEAIRTRRTHKVFQSDPVPKSTLEELFELARWAPNHHLTNPWRFRVLGEKSLARLKEADPDGAKKLDRAPTLVVASVELSGKSLDDQEDRDAAACAAYIVLLAAHDCGLVGYWRTPGILRKKKGRKAVDLPANEAVIGLLYLGHPRQTKSTPRRKPVKKFVSYLP